MERIGVRELRQHASRWLKRVAAGEIIEITERGRPVAVLSPPRDMSARERLLASGRLIPAEGDLRDVEPLPAQPGSPTLSDTLAHMRDEERY